MNLEWTKKFFFILFIIIKMFLIHARFKYPPWISLQTLFFLQCRSISRVEISLKILSGNYVAIALVDQYKLRYLLTMISFFYLCFLHFYFQVISPQLLHGYYVIIPCIFSRLVQTQEMRKNKKSLLFFFFWVFMTKYISVLISQVFSLIYTLYFFNHYD